MATRNPAALTYPEFNTLFTFNKSRMNIARDANGAAIDAHAYAWQPRCRMQSDTLSRMHAARPSEGERYFLRLLLATIPGSEAVPPLNCLIQSEPVDATCQHYNPQQPERLPRSGFEQLLYFQGHRYPTYRDACIARGLLHDDQEWHRCMSEAALSASARQLRGLFVSIIMHTQDEALNISHLWESFKDICRIPTHNPLIPTLTLAVRTPQHHSLTLP